MTGQLRQKVLYAGVLVEEVRPFGNSQKSLFDCSGVILAHLENCSQTALGRCILSNMSISRTIPAPVTICPIRGRYRRISAGQSGYGLVCDGLGPLVRPNTPPTDARTAPAIVQPSIAVIELTFAESGTSAMQTPPISAAPPA